MLLDGMDMTCVKKNWYAYTKMDITLLSNSYLTVGWPSCIMASQETPYPTADFREAIHMSKNIVVITGSPRKNGNSFAMTDAFIQAAQAKGHTVTRFDAAMLKIGGCHACETCYKTGKACSFDDDFNTIAPAILEADAVVFTMPVYWYSIPAQIKGVIDRLFSLVVGGKDVAGKECAMIVCCEEAEMDVMDGVRIPLERTAALLKWKMVGEVLVPSVLNVGDIAKTDGCAQAAALAEKF